MIFLLLQGILSQQFAADFLFRMHNHESWVGPKTKFDGYSGRILQINENTNIENLLSNKRPYPEVIVIPLGLMKDEIINKIIELYTPKPYLQGFVVTNDDSVDYSADVPFPNRQYMSYTAPDDFQWNPRATSMVQHIYDFPFIYPPKAEVENLEAHIKKYGSKAGIYIRVYMLSRGNSKKCLKASDCQMVGGLSMYGSFNENYNKSSVWAIANFDSFGFFPYAHVGADYSISGFVSLLAALQSFQNVDWSKAQKQLRFAFFDGEELGFLGSTKFLTDLEKFECEKWDKEKTICMKPYRLDFGFQSIPKDETFDTVIEIKSVANASALYVHTNKNGREFGKTLVGTSSALPVEMADDSLPGVPPSSVNSFIKKFPNIKHAVLTGYQGTFPANNRYGMPSEVLYNPEAVTKASQTLADTLAKLCGITYKPVVNQTIVSELMLAFVNAPADSQYIKQLFPTSNVPTDHVSLYAGVYNQYTMEMKHLLVRDILKESTAFNITNIPCTADANCSEYGLSCSISRNKCVNYTMNLHPAYSNAFEYDDDEWETTVVNESLELPFDCEANWDSTELHFISLPSLYSGRVTVGIGILLWVLLSALLSAFWNYNMNFLQS
ncbi:hypothetical protein TRFO_37361 [Tritrichomonas foetus]|uniref:Nicastrin n=1 Tax=Tritrichomonas foetus TaxID=1144522 RepID=A0A1J4JG92_9EUKA|nr:hypothetical protein TRFO_37361 [Tritrichomonas foetus]|eukprot:OHS96469.1 hypothetical protein TRFO_37361 [Tritrichomonas foetus]